MKDPDTKVLAKPGQFSLTSAFGEKLGAIEGLALSPRMAAIRDRCVREGLNTEQQRLLIRETLRGRQPM